MVCSGDEEVLHHVICTELRSLDATATTVLAAVVVAAGALDVTATGNSDDHFLFRNEVFDIHVAVEARHDLGTTVVTVTGNDVSEFFRDNLTLARRASQDGVELSDLSFQFVGFVDDLLALESCQTAQLHLQDGTSLQLVNLEEVDQAVASIFNSRALAN